MRTNQPQPKDATYDRLYEFAIKAESCIDFIERMEIVATVIVDELTKRLTETPCYFPLQLIPVIEKMNKEVYILAENINTTTIIKDQPLIEQPLFMRVLQTYGVEIYKDYNKAKFVLVN